MREVDQFLRPAGDKITLATDGTGGRWPAGPQIDVISGRKWASLPPAPLPKSRHELNLSADVWARDEASASRGSRSLQRTDLHVTSSCGDGETGQITSGGNELGPEQPRKLTTEQSKYLLFATCLNRQAITCLRRTPRNVSKRGSNDKSPLVHTCGFCSQTSHSTSTIH
jgi:hypothetical protein